MRQITVLSPHLDDAAFSLYLWLARWSSASLQLRVVNFFTVSSYAPRTPSTSPNVISDIRKREDRQALSLISTGIGVECLDLLDAPLRLGIGVDRVCNPDAARLQDGLDADALGGELRKYFAQGLVLAPLGLGNHIDHLAVREAAISASAYRKLGFYEDLPYAAWTPVRALHNRISETEQRTGLRLRPCVIRSDHAAISRKGRVIGKYQSQIGRRDASAIVRFASTYRGGERIWIPKHSRAWRTLISDA